METIENIVIKNDIHKIKDVFSRLDKDTAVICFNYNPNTVLPKSEFIKKYFAFSAKKFAGSMPNAIFHVKKISKEMLSNIKNIFITVNLFAETSYKESKEIIKNIIKIKKICDKKNVHFGISENNQNFLSGVYDDNNKYYEDIVNALKAVTFSGLRERYEYIYDIACDYLDAQFRKNNYCDFRDNRCKMVQKYNCKDPAHAGCCHSYRLFRVLTVDFMYDHKPCIHIGPSGCTEKCIGCKLYTCDVLKKEGVKFSLNKILLTDCFFNFKQKMVMKNNIFRRKDEIIEKLLEISKNKSTLLWFYLCGKHMIRTKFE